MFPDRGHCRRATAWANPYVTPVSKATRAESRCNKFIFEGWWEFALVFGTEGHLFYLCRNAAPGNNHLSQICTKSSEHPFADTVTLTMSSSRT